MAKKLITMEMRKKNFDDLKKKHPEALLLFRQGDFYVAYSKDAEKVAEVLGLPTYNVDLLDKNCSFPHHCLDTYLPKLIRANCRVAICDDLFTATKTENTDNQSNTTDMKEETQKPAQPTAEAEIAQENKTQEASANEQKTAMELDDELYDAMGEILHKAEAIEEIAAKFRKAFQDKYTEQTANIPNERHLDMAIKDMRHSCERLADLTTMWGHILAVRDMAEDYVCG